MAVGMDQGVAGHGAPCWRAKRRMSTTLSASQTNAWINSEYFAAVVDVRSWNEFNNGHFPYATLVANLNVHGNAATLQG